MTLFNDHHTCAVGTIIFSQQKGEAKSLAQGLASTW